MCVRTRDFLGRVLELLSVDRFCCLAFALLFARASVGSQTSVTTRRRILRRVAIERAHFFGGIIRLAVIFVNRIRVTVRS